MTIRPSQFQPTTLLIGILEWSSQTTRTCWQHRQLKLFSATVDQQTVKINAMEGNEEMNKHEARNLHVRIRVNAQQQQMKCIRKIEKQWNPNWQFGYVTILEV